MIIMQQQLMNKIADILTEYKWHNKPLEDTIKEIALKTGLGSNIPDSGSNNRRAVEITSWEDLDSVINKEIFIKYDDGDGLNSRSSFILKNFKSKLSIKNGNNFFISTKYNGGSEIYHNLAKKDFESGKFKVYKVV